MSMTNQEILDSAPEGWAHVSNHGTYYRINDGIPEFYHNDGVEPDWLETRIPNLTRSREDIERIVELEKTNEGLRDSIKQINKEAIKQIKELENTLHERTVNTAKRILELEQALEQLTVQPILLKDLLDGVEYPETKNSIIKSVTKGLKKHDLEQQAKGIEDAATELASPYGAIPVDALHEYAKQLRNKAKELDK